jgi:hypothetical protein
LEKKFGIAVLIMLLMGQGILLLLILVFRESPSMKARGLAK